MKGKRMQQTIKKLLTSKRARNKKVVQLNDDTEKALPWQ
jgi:hypothetical protein